MPPLNNQTAAQAIGRLKGSWTRRNTKVRDWYNQLLQVNDLQQEGLESFISNNPRTTYNLALHLITPPDVPMRIPIDPLQDIEVPDTSEVERALRVMWKRVDAFNRTRGRKGWRRELNSYILATGWFAVYADIVDDPRLGTQVCLAEIWSPVDTYPAWDDDVGLSEVVHSQNLTRRAMNRKAEQLGWQLPNLTGDLFPIDDYWYLDEDSGVPTNLVMLQGRIIFGPEPAPDFYRLPVFISPAGGLPDRGSIITNQSWMEHVGEAMLATNEFVQRNYNRQMTFLQQLLRDTAQPVSYEKRSGGNIVNDPNQLYRRGAHFRMGLQDDLGYLAKPPIPVDFRTSLFDIDGMLQRGSLPHMMFGNIQAQVTGYLISQVSASAQQHLTPYAEATTGCQADISNFWLDLIQNHGRRPYELKVPKLPPGVEVEAQLHVNIPGDLTQRGTVARMLNPNFQISQSIIMDLLFPEITDPQREMARVRSELSQQHPIALQINLVRAYNEQAEILRSAGDTDGSNLFRAAATAISQQLQQQISAGGQPPQNGQPSGAFTPPQQVQPRQGIEAAAGVAPGGLG